MEGHLGHVRSVAFSPDESLAPTVSSGGTIGRRDTATDARQITLRGHRGKVWSACFTRDGRQVIDSGNHGSVRRWWIRAEDVFDAAEAPRNPRARTVPWCEAPPRRPRLAAPRIGGQASEPALRARSRPEPRRCRGDVCPGECGYPGSAARRALRLHGSPT